MTRSLGGWTEMELDAAVLNLLVEFPDARMAACSRAREYCRQSLPRGAPATLFLAMRERLSLDFQAQRPIDRLAA